MKKILVLLLMVFFIVLPFNSYGDLTKEDKEWALNYIKQVNKELKICKETAEEIGEQCKDTLKIMEEECQEKYEECQDKYNKLKENLDELDKKINELEEVVEGHKHHD